jgi:hypothetical protein
MKWLVFKSPAAETESKERSWLIALNLNGGSKMRLIEKRIAGALMQAAERWTQALIVVQEPTAPQLIAIAVRRDCMPRIGRTVPNPFRWRKG